MRLTSRKNIYSYDQVLEVEHCDDNTTSKHKKPSNEGWPATIATTVKPAAKYLTNTWCNSQRLCIGTKLHVQTLCTNSRLQSCTTRDNKKLPATICREKYRHVTNKLKHDCTKQPTMWGNTNRQQTTWPTYIASRPLAWWKNLLLTNIWCNLWCNSLARNRHTLSIGRNTNVDGTKQPKMRGNTNMQQNTWPTHDATRYGSVLARNHMYTRYAQTRDYKITNKLKHDGTKQPTMWGNTNTQQTTWPTYNATCYGSVLARNYIDK